MRRRQHRPTSAATVDIKRRRDDGTYSESSNQSTASKSETEASAASSESATETTENEEDVHIGTNVTHRLATVDVATGVDRTENVYPMRHGLLHDDDSVSVGGDGLSVGSGTSIIDDNERAKSNKRTVPTDECISGPPAVITTDEVCEFVAKQTDRHLVVDIYEQASDRDSGKFLRTLLSSSRRNSVPTKYRNSQTYIVTEHNIKGFEHYHAIHLCCWAKYSCRCGRLEAFKQYNLCSRKVYPLARMEAQAVRQVLIYHLGGERTCIYCEISGQLRRLCCEDRDILQGDSCGLATAGLVETRAAQIQNRSERGLGTNENVEQLGGLGRKLVGGPSVWNTKGGKYTARDGTPPSQYPKGPCTTEMWTSLLEHLSTKRIQVTFGDVMVVMKKFLVTPITGIPYCIDWMDVPRMASVNPTGLVFDSALRTLRGELNKLDIMGAYEFQTASGATPIYGAGCLENVENTYWNLNQSLYMLLDLLHFQFDADLDRVKNFLTLNYNVYSRVTGKHNCLCIIGPANSGKNFWIDGVCDFSLNPGKMENPNRSNAQFAWSQCHHRRTLKWDECQFDHYFDPQVLNLLQGKPFMANMKYKNPEAVVHTPLFVLSNIYPFSNEIRFRDRIYLVKFNRCERLAQYQLKQPLPLAQGILLMYGVSMGAGIEYKYNIEKMWEHIVNKYK